MTHRAAWGLTVLHVLGLGLGLFGILVVVPHPQTIVHTPEALAFFNWALFHTGALSLVLAALALIAYGGPAIGWARTLIFAVVSCGISAAAELTGTATGWPFGGYAYTGLLGPKISGRVPFAVPLSWFFMGFAAYLLALAILQRRGRGGWRAPLVSIALGAWLLTGWDLVLDPAMASPSLGALRFWTWFEHGPYFGMPLRNLVGWYGTGFLFIGVARLLWRGEPDVRKTSLQIPFVIYVANIVWAMAISLSADLWPSALLALVFTLVPAAFALW
jgi:putative membrane protein